MRVFLEFFFFRLDSLAIFFFDEKNSLSSFLSFPSKHHHHHHTLKTIHSPDTYYGEEVSVLEMDGAFDKLEELIYVESHLSQTSSKFYGEITQQMLKNSAFPGSTNGTGLFQTIVGLKIREVYEKIVKKEVAAVSA